jgi:voltage-gated sodium channel
MKNKLRLFIESNIASNFILGVIIYNSIILGLMTYPVLMAKFGAFLHYTNFTCVIIFTIEMAIKLYVYGKSFFKDGWNNFDFILVAISWVPTGGVFSSFRAFRVLRALRALRLITRMQKLRLIVQAIIESVPNVAWASVLLMLIFYIFAIMGTTMYTEASPEYFGSIGKSMYTLFQIMTLDDWSTEIVRPICEIHPFAWVYFISFILVSAFVVLNVIVGVIVNAIGELSEFHKKKEELKKLRKATNLEKELSKLKKQISIVESLIAVENEE